MDLRRELLDFSILMESKLREHDIYKGRSGWRDIGVSGLLSHLSSEYDELMELRELLLLLLGMDEVILDRLSVGILDRLKDMVRNELLDLSNMCMMVNDVL